MTLTEVVQLLDTLLGGKDTQGWAVRRDATSSPLAVTLDKVAVLISGVPPQWRNLYMWPTGDPVVAFYEASMFPTTTRRAGVYQAKLPVPGIDAASSVWVTVNLAALPSLQNLPSLEVKLAELYTQLENELWKESN
jgi:hypothetical protein